MKTVQILPEMNAGGVERVVFEIAADLARAGHESIVISNGGKMVAGLENTGVRHVVMPVHRKHPASLLQVGPLRQFLTDEVPDLVHMHSRVPGWIAWLAWRGMDRATRPRLASTVHGFYSVNRYSAIMARGERVIAVSESIRSYIRENYPATPEDRIRVVSCGIRLEESNAGFQADDAWLARWKADHPQLAGKQVLLLPGRITRLKGHEDYFRLVAGLKRDGMPVHGLVAGDTHPKKRAYLAELHELVASLGLASDISFLGHRGDIREVMSVSDLVCALSQQPESFGLTVLEALALGKPVVGYDCGGVGELLAAMFPAGRVPPGKAPALLGTARSILNEQPEPSAVGPPFTLDAMCRSTLDVYRELVESPR